MNWNINYREAKGECNTLKIYENSSNQDNDNSLVIAHWYGRCWKFYRNIILKILEFEKYKRVINFDFPWHWSQLNWISFENSKDFLYSALKFARNNCDWDVVLWWHSYWAFISSCLADKNSDKNIDDFVGHLILSSLPFSMNWHKYMNMLKMVKNPHEKVIKWRLFNVFVKMWLFSVENWIIKCGDLFIPDLNEYIKELLSMPGLEKISQIEIPTTLIRARVDEILGLITINWKSFWPRTWVYNKIHEKFLNLKEIVTLWEWHWLWVQKIEKNPNYNSRQIRELIKTIVSV